jgi:indolepyruvate ferredoxin oxidoreductase alpha subunit
MGAAISQAAGFYQAFRGQANPPDLIATMGDSTFFHAGIPALIDTVVQRVRCVLVILDNGTTAMTGNQPTPATGFGADGEELESVQIEQVVRGCGVRFCRVGDPYDLKAFTSMIRDALRHSRENGPAVVIARRACPLATGSGKAQAKRVPVTVAEDCDGCGYCLEQFECPALVFDEAQKKVSADPLLCRGCGVCVQVCPKRRIKRRTAKP